MKINKDGMDLIKKHESLKLTPYFCPANKLTVGWGHTGKDIIENKKYTPQECEILFKKDISFFENGVNKLLKCNLNLNQFSALVSLSYNIGLNNLKESSLLKDLNSGKNANFTARKQFKRWIYANGKPLPGLIKRREDETYLFIKEIYDEKV